MQCGSVVATGEYVIVAITDSAEYLLGNIVTAPCCQFKVSAPYVSVRADDAINLAREVQDRGTLNGSDKLVLIPYDILRDAVN